MLIRGARVWGSSPDVPVDVRIEGGRIARIGTLPALPGETVHEAGGGTLLPGLHDHHIHLAATAVRRTSVACGPPDVLDAEALARSLALPGAGWIRGIGFHESVLGGHLPDATTLDRLVPHRPLRIQHRTGRMWLLNSLALDELLRRADPPPGLDRATGRLFDEDGWLQRALGSLPPDLSSLSAELARHGLTGVTDMSPRNDVAMATHFSAQAASRSLRQRVVLAGSAELADAQADDWRLGPLKLHLHEAALPDPDLAADFIRAGHRRGRPVAIHCVTEVELVFALAVLEQAGPETGDRIEHVSIASPDQVGSMAEMGLWACVQPHFIAERGDRYLADVEPRHHGDLYRLQHLSAAGLPLSAGSDAPYGSVDPWAAMAAAVNRRTATGTVIGPREALSPEQALALYLVDPLDFRRQRRVEPGAPADLCLLHRPWHSVRDALDTASVAATWVSGQLVYQAPFQRARGADPAT